MSKTDEFLPFAGRRKGRPLHDGRAKALRAAEENLLIAPDVLQATIVDPAVFFADATRPLWLEIGFGNGEHLVGQAENHPDVNFLGCEPFLNGVSAAAVDIAHKRLTNLRIWPDDALTLLSKFPDAATDRIYLLFSDPWPKTRNHKRRVIQPESVALFARLLKPGGLLRLATDHRHLAEWMLLHCCVSPDLQWTHFADGEWRVVPDGWIDTRFQQKAAQLGRLPYFMDFKKL